jgi:hypothetical protein
MNDTRSTLHWAAFPYGVSGHRVLKSPLADCIYVIYPEFELRRRKYVFVGFDVRYVTRCRTDDDPCGDGTDHDADDDNVRVIQTRAQTETEAKAIAQADFNNTRDEEQAKGKV